MSHLCFIFFFFFFFFFFFIFFSLAAPRSMWDLSFPTADGTHAPYTGSAESLPLDCQGSTLCFIFYTGVCCSTQMKPTKKMRVGVDIGHL